MKFIQSLFVFVLCLIASSTLANDTTSVKIKVQKVDTVCRYYIIYGINQKNKNITILSEKSGCSDIADNVYKDSTIMPGEEYVFAIIKMNAVRECNGRLLQLSNKGSFFYQGKKIVSKGQSLYKSLNTCGDFIRN